LSLKEIFSIERGVTANIILLDFKTVPTKLYELLAAGRRIIYVGPKVADLETLLERFSIRYICFEAAGSTPTKSDVLSLCEFLSEPDDPDVMKQRGQLVIDELSARVQTQRLAAIFDKAAQECSARNEDQRGNSDQFRVRTREGGRP